MTQRATQKTYDLEGFVEALELLIRRAKQHKLVSASVNLDPTGLGHYAYRLVDGDDTHDVIPAEPVFDTSDTDKPTAPGKKLGRKKDDSR
jgi:hypothetical protein